LQCIELSHSHPEIDCKPYFENYKKCNQFWVSGIFFLFSVYDQINFVFLKQLAVQEYRSKVMKKRRFDLPVGEEYEKWKRQLPEWAQTGVLNPPDDENV